MIAGLRGRIVENDAEGRALVAVGPVTLELWMPASHALALRPGEEIELHTYLHYSSSSDQLRLYAFEDHVSRELFTTLIGGSGVGPKVALSLLELGAAGLVAAVRDGDEKTLTSIRGVGPKLAKKILLELGEKVAREFAQVAEQAGRGLAETGPAADVLDAVVALGFTRVQAEQALAQVRMEYQDDDTTGLIRRVLARLAGG